MNNAQIQNMQGGYVGVNAEMLNPSLVVLSQQAVLNHAVAGFLI